MKIFYSKGFLYLYISILLVICQPSYALNGDVKVSAFIENKGQIADLKGQARDDIKFTFIQNGTKLFVTESGIYYQFMNPISSDKMELHRIQMQLVGAIKPSEIRKEGKSNTYDNFYLLGKSITNVHSYSKITFKNVYPKIDWVIYIKNDVVEYDFVVHPGADPNQIKLKYEDADQIHLNENGSLAIGTRLGLLTESRPITSLKESNQIIASAFVLENNTISFQVEVYDKNKTLVIDPTLVWSRYAGGNLEDVVNKVTENMAFGTSSSTFGIATSGGFQTVFGGTKDAFYSYFDNDGTIVYSTYFGGSGTEEAFSGAYVADGANSKAIIVGQTNSTNGIAQAGLVSFASLNGATDGFIAVFLANGTLQFSSYFGGNDNDYISDVKLSGAANDFSKLLVSGVTSSSTGFSAANSFQGGEDAFIAKLDLSSNNIVSTQFNYFGGTSSEISNTLAIGKNKRYFLSGNTASNSGIASIGAFDTALSGPEDDFIACFDENLNLSWASYYGGATSEKYGTSRNGSYCDVDTNGFVYLLGNSSSPGLASSGAYDASINGLEDFFLAKFDSLGNRIWGTYFGGNFSDIATSIDVNNYNQILMAGSSNSPDMEIKGLGFVSLSHNNNDIDALLVQFAPDGQLIWSSPLGTAQGNEFFNSVYFNNSNIIAGGTTTSAFGLAYTSSSTYGGGGDALLARINDRAITTLPISNSSLCPGDSILINFSTIGKFPANTIYRAELYPNFAVINPIILGTNTTGNGIIRGFIPLATTAAFSGNSIKVVSNLPSNPPIASTSQSVGAIGSLPNSHIFPLTSTNICEGNSVVLKSPSNTNIVFRQWQQFKNNNWLNIAGANSISYAADSAGTYRVITTSVTGCDSTSNSINVLVSAVPTATISAVSQLFCLGDFLVLNANIGAGYTYQWFRNNAALPNRNSDTLQVQESGNYSVKVTNSAGCSTTSALFAVTGLLKPPAQIVALGNLEICNGQSTTLSANNSPGVSYQWYKNDTLIPGATLRTFAATTSGNYFVKELNTNNCDSSSNSISIAVYPYPIATISYSGLPYTCLGNSINLKTSAANDFTYSWLLNGTAITGATDSIYAATLSGNYVVVVTNHGICSDSSSALEINPIPSKTDICYASIDTAFGKTAVKLFWEKPLVPYVKGYVIFRDIAGLGFTAVDTISNTQFSTYTDTAARPESTVQRYKVATLDSCDQLSDINLSTTHQTILLQGALDNTGTYIGWEWQPYAGISDALRYYRVMRDNNGTGVWDSITATPWSVTTWNDTAINYSNARYAVDLVWQSNCNPSQRIAGFVNTRSNIKNRANIGVGIQSIQPDQTIKLLPNPAEKFIKIEFIGNGMQQTLSIYDKLGRALINQTYEKVVGKTSIEISLETFASGIYTVRLQSSTKTETQKLIVR